MVQFVRLYNNQPCYLLAFSTWIHKLSSPEAGKVPWVSAHPSLLQWQPVGEVFLETKLLCTVLLHPPGMFSSSLPCFIVFLAFLVHKILNVDRWPSIHCPAHQSTNSRRTGAHIFVMSLYPWIIVLYVECVQRFADSFLILLLLSFYPALLIPSFLSWITFPPGLDSVFLNKTYYSFLIDAGLCLNFLMFLCKRLI